MRGRNKHQGKLEFQEKDGFKILVVREHVGYTGAGVRKRQTKIWLR